MPTFAFQPASCRKLLFSLNLPELPAHSTSADRELYISGLVDLDHALTARDMSRNTRLIPGADPSSGRPHPIPGEDVHRT